MEHGIGGDFGERLERVARLIAAPPQSQRAIRYRGEDRAVALSAMAEADRSAARALYAALQSFVTELRGRPEGSAVAASAASLDVDRVVDLARELGRAGGPSSPEVRHAIHDVRGGALTSLVLEAHRARTGKGSVRALTTLAGDHLKVMRNALLELDDARREADLAVVAHPVELLVETLSRITFEGAHGEVHVDVSCRVSGPVAMSCMELGALDRAVLNVVGNAVRHSARDTVEVAIFPVPAGACADVRIVVVNAIEDGPAAALVERFGPDLSPIFLEAFSTTGSGEGLKICVDFVASAYGFGTRDAVRLGLVGAALDGGAFVAWLHWPAVA